MKLGIWINNHKKMAFFLNILILVVNLVVTTLIVTFTKNQSFSIIFVVGFFVFIWGMYCTLDSIDKKIIIALIIFAVFLIGLGKYVVSISSMYEENQDSMIGFFGTMISSIVAALIGVFGAYLGSKVGGEESRKASLEAVEKQISYEKELQRIEKETKDTILIKMMISMLVPEINYNYRVVTCENNFKHHLIERLQDNDEPFTGYSFDNSRFKFDEFNDIKHELFGNSCLMANNIIEQYTAFKILSNTGSIDALDNQQYLYIKRILLSNLCD